MTNEERKEKIKALQIKNRRKILQNEITNQIKGLTIDGFIDVDDTITMSAKIYNKIDQVNEKKKVPKGFEYSKEYLLTLQPKITKITNKTMILFHHSAWETGAMKIRFHDFFIDLNTLLKFIGVADDYSDLLFVEQDLSMGICIERFEYENSIIVWGLNFFEGLILSPFPFFKPFGLCKWFR